MLNRDIRIGLLGGETLNRDIRIGPEYTQSCKDMQINETRDSVKLQRKTESLFSGVNSV